MMRVDRLFVLALVAMLSACEDSNMDPTPPRPLDQCTDLTKVTGAADPTRIRTGSSSVLSAQGGNGSYTFTLGSGANGIIVGTRYTASLTPGTEHIDVTDGCGKTATIDIEVVPPFDVQPVRARVAPGTQFQIQTNGLVGHPKFTLESTLASGGSLTDGGVYQAGSMSGLDLITVVDDGTNERVLVQYSVAPGASLQASPAKVALPTGTKIPLNTLNGSGFIEWTVQGVGEVVNGVYWSPDAGGGDATLEGFDTFTREKTTVNVRVLTELTRPNRAQGRRTDFGAMVTGDFDGDGIRDLAVGIPESDLSRPQGGAVFIFKGSLAGFSNQPAWRITGNTDTAQLGAVLAAGDLDGDGRDDLAIAAPGSDITVTDSGGVYLYKITDSGPQLIREPMAGVGRANFGTSLAIADIDGDGRNDLIVGSPGADLAPTGAINSRGVIDVFRAPPGALISDVPVARIGGVDLAADGGTRPTTGTRAGRGLVVADLNDDGTLDVATVTTVNNSLLEGVALARQQNAVQVHFGRTGHVFEQQPDLYVLPVNAADSQEGTWRIGFMPKTDASPPLLIAVADQLDSPNLSASGGLASGTNSGGAYLYSLVSYRPSGAASANPIQLGRTDAWARFFGENAGGQAGRSFTTMDVTGDGQPELILGSPYAPAQTKSADGGVGPNITLGGRLLAYSVHGIDAGTIANRAVMSRNGRNRVDVLGTALVLWKRSSLESLVALNGRASTQLGDFTGRLDVLTAPGSFDEWKTESFDIPNVPAAQQLGAAIELFETSAGPGALVGSPAIAGPGPDSSGSEIAAGQALKYELAQPALPQIVVEGSATAYVRDGGWLAYGGRALASDVTVTDFDGDKRPDLIIGAPNLVAPLRIADGGLNIAGFVDRPACVPAASQTSGGALIYVGQADGTFKEGYRLWAPTTIAGCDGGTGQCGRASLSSRGIVGRFDFNGDDVEDLAMTRNNGAEVFLGRPLDDATMNRRTMVCDPVMSLPFLSSTVFSPVALGDLDGDGCHEVGARYSDNSNRFGVLILFGFDPNGAKCNGHDTPSWLRISGDAEKGVAAIRLGTSMARAGKVLAGDTREFVAVTADTYLYGGISQPAVLLFAIDELAALRPAQGERLVGALNDGLVPVPVFANVKAPGFGRMLAGGADVSGDGVPDLIVSALGANVNGDGTGAVFVFRGGELQVGANAPWMTVVSSHLERANFGNDLSFRPKQATQPARLGIGAPLSYRSGTSNGTAYVLPFDF